MQKSMKKSLNILDDLCQFVQKWPRSSDEDPEDFNELLFEFDLAINLLTVHAKKTKNYEFFQLCLTLQNNLEILQETPPSSKQIELLCAWPIQISEYLSNRDDKEVVETLSTFLSDSNWPLQSSRSQIEQITHRIEKPKSTSQHPDFHIDENTQNKKRLPAPVAARIRMNINGDVQRGH